MDWSLVSISLVLLWMLSFCIFLGASRGPARSLSLSNGTRNVLLVAAHPDDESMFFSPTILYLTSNGHNVHILCLSTGNADGKGDIREDELYKACLVLKVPLRQVKILNHPSLQDGFDKAWNYQLLAKLVGDEIVTLRVDLLITFDKYGVSGHPNHRAVHQGIRLLLSENSGRIEAWELISTSIVRKYIGPVDIWFTILSKLCYPKGYFHFFINEHPQKGFLAMAQHSSQWVWFRKLFVLFSSYTYINTLRKIHS